MTAIATKEVREFLDFGGGIDQILSPNRIDKNAVQAASNVWHDTGAVRVRGAMIMTPATVTPGNFAVTNLGYGFQFQSGASVYYVYDGTSSVADLHPFQSTNPQGTAGNFTVIGHKIGTASTTVGSPIVTGVGTTWMTHLRAGDYFTIDSRNAWVRIASVDSDTQLTLAANYATLNSGVTYTVAPNFSPPSFSGTVNNLTYAAINNRLYMSNGSRTPGYWDGTNFYTSTNFPKMRYLKVFKNYMFGFHDPATPNKMRVQWSALNDAEAWPASNFIDVSPNDGEVGTGIFNDGQSLILLKKKSAYKLSGDTFDPQSPTYTLTKMYTPAECVFNGSKPITIYENRYFLWGGTSIYEYRGGNVISRIKDSDKMLKTFTSSPWAATTLQDVQAMTNQQSFISFNGKLWMTSTLGSDLSIVVIERNGSFWLFDATTNGVIILDLFIVPSTSGGPTLYAAYHDIGLGTYGVCKLDQSYVNEAITASFTTRVMEYAQKQVFTLAYLHFKRTATGTITFSYAIDEGAYTNVSVDMTYGSGTRTKSVPIKIGRVGTSINFRVTHSGSAEDFEVYGIEYFSRSLRL